MAYVKILYDGKFYDYEYADPIEMSILGLFLSNVGCAKNGRSIFRDWALADKNDLHSGFTHTCGINAISLEEDDNGDIHLIDDTGSDEDDIYYIPARLKVTRQQFVQILDDWQEKVCKHKPKQVIIKHENGQFAIETSD